VLANLLTLATLVYAWLLLRTDTDHYYRSVQEDQALEWASFVAFLVAAILFAVAAARQRRATGLVPWFLAGLGLFCFVVAMEEISWAQRMFAYRPPAYFLEHNFQQELNFHNVVDTDLRIGAVKIVLLGYGVLFPLATLYRPLRRRLAGWAIIAPPVILIPLFLISFFVYSAYTWEFTGEWIELMMGLGFMFAALPPMWAWRSGGEGPPGSGQRVAVALWWLGVVLSGFLLAFASERLRGQQPELIELARAEANALRLDFLALDDACQGKSHVNKRIYSYVEKYGEEELYEGAFAALTRKGLPEERARFFLDPWNSPYWIQCTIESNRRFHYVYSFGPNRRRESTEWQVLGDDVGAILLDRDRD
jgi:hypothetical protein